MAVLGNNVSSGFRVPTVYTSAGGRVNTPLNAAYVHGTSGPAVAIRYQSRVAAAVTEAYLMLDDIAGTLASISMGCRIYREHASSGTQAGTLLVSTAASVTMPNAIDKWLKATFTDGYVPTIGETMWIVFFNSSVAPTTDYPMIQTQTSLNVPGGGPTQAVAYTTTAGWSAAGGVQGETPFAVVQGAVVTGQPITASSNTIWTSSTLMRGFQFTPPVNTEVVGWQTSAPSTVYSGIRFYKASVGPGGSPDYTYNLGTDSVQSRDELIGSKIWSPITLVGGQAYNVVATFGAAGVVSTAITEDYSSFPTVFDALFDYFTSCPGVIDNGAGGWALRKDMFPGFQVIISGFPPPAAALGRSPKVWNGSAWVEKQHGVWNGSAWVEEPIKVWDGSVWKA